MKTLYLKLWVDHLYKSKHLPVNYRPVSLTCVCSKVMEHVIVSQVNRHLESLGIPDRNQHGFRRGLSTETQLMDFIQELHTGTANGKQVDAVVMDFSKAFDKVAHNRLLYKINKYGIQGKTAAWIKDFLSGRTQRVALEGQFSGEVPVTSGSTPGICPGPPPVSSIHKWYLNKYHITNTSFCRWYNHLPAYNISGRQWGPAKGPPHPREMEYGLADGFSPG